MQVLNTMPQSIYIYGLDMRYAEIWETLCLEARSTFYYIRYSKHNFAKKKILSKQSTATT